MSFNPNQYEKMSKDELISILKNKDIEEKRLSVIKSGISKVLKDKNFDLSRIKEIVSSNTINDVAAIKTQILNIINSGGLNIG